MKVVEKKFQIINVGVELISDQYREWLKKQGYELDSVNTGPSGEICSYTYKLKDEQLIEIEKTLIIRYGPDETFSFEGGEIYFRGPRFEKIVGLGFKNCLIPLHLEGTDLHKMCIPQVISQHGYIKTYISKKWDFKE